MATMDEMFNDDQREVNWTAPTLQGWTPLPMPALDDSLSALTKKIEDLAAVVEAGNSVAFCKGSTHDPEVVAKDEMTAKEAWMFTAWRNGTKMAYINWANCTEGVPTADGKQKRWAEAAVYLNIIYGRADITAGNAVWYYNNKGYLVPLINAVRRVEKKKKRMEQAKGDLLDGQHMVSELEFAEIQTIAEAVNVTTSRQAGIMAEMRKLARSIDQSRAVLQSRENAIKIKLRGL